MAISNNNSKNVQISVVLNKSKREGKKCILSYLHNAVIKCQTNDHDAQWIEFRLLGTDKEGNLSKSPMFAQQGRNEIAVDADKFMSALYGTSEVDVRFTFDMKPEITDELLDSGKALKISFGLTDLKEEGETEYQGQWTKKVRIINANCEILDSYYGIGRTIDPEHVAAALEAAATAPKSQYVTATELAQSAEKLVAKSRNARRKERKREERASLLQNTIANNAVQEQPVAELQTIAPTVVEPVKYEEYSEYGSFSDIEEGKEVDELDAFTLDLLGLN